MPVTALRLRYHRLKEQGVSAATRAVECAGLINDVSPLVDEFIGAVHDWRMYDLRDEAFYEPKQRGVPRNKGTGIVTDLLERTGSVAVSGSAGYTFRYRHREVSPLRTPRGVFFDGTVATRSGLGGIDYVALVEGQAEVPVIGEIKFRDDKDPFFALIQLLTYLSELCTEAQTLRASRFLFDGHVSYPVRWDLHILLADYNDRGRRGPLVASAKALVVRFKAALSEHGESALLGRVLCLRMDTAIYNGSLDLAWEA